MKKFTITALIFLSFSFLPAKANANQEIKECPMGSAETLVCEVVFCSVGLFIDASRPKCIQVTREFAIYLASLGFWSSPPSCKTRDINCNVTGNASSAVIDPNICDGLSTESERNSCKAASGEVIQEFCDTFTGADQQSCEAKIN
jgi:hypothetical protein